MKSTSTSNWISITQNDEATNDKQENTIQLEPQALKTVEKVHKTTTGVTTVPKLHQVIRRRKVHKRKRVPTPIALPFGCLRSKVQVKAQECHDCTSPKNGFSFHSEGTSLSPIHNRLATVPSNLTALSHTRIKRRLGLVRRTHSPMTVPSPVSKSVFKSIASKTKSDLPYFTMGSNAAPISGEAAPQLIFQPLPGNAKKRKRSQSPKNTNRSRSRSPIGRRTRPDTSTSKDSQIETTSAINVKMVSPTLRGVTESAKILRYGIFSFPTETMYSLVSFIPFKRRTKQQKSNGDHRMVDCHWETLMRMKYRDEMPSQHTYNSDPPLLYIHKPADVRYYASFSKPKTFVFKQQDPDKDSERKPNEGDTQTKYTAVTFSESHEVINRLASAFWPGPVTIFAPVKRVRSRSSSSFASKTSKEDNARADISHRATSSCSSLTSLTSENGDDQPPTLFTNDYDCDGTDPILPVSALRSLDSLLESSNDDDKKKVYYVGMRCPSHPLARRILAEVYGERDTKTPLKAHQRIPGAVVGFNASISGQSSSSLPLLCKNVCTSLLSIQDHFKFPFQKEYKPTVHVMNGEDRREMFFVPPCQYGQSSAVSLVVNALSRTITIIRNESSLNSKKVSEDFELRAKDVARALLHQNGDESGSVKSRAITAVMHKWRVHEKET